MVSTTIILAAAVSFCLTSVLGFVVIPWLRKLKYGQTILDIGPVWHKSKEGTPTMGGLQFIIGVIAAMITVVLTDSFSSEKVLTGEAPLFKTRLWGGLIMALGFALIGFFDDYIKVVKKRNLGLTAKQKTFLQLLIAAGYMITLYIAGDSSMYIPFIGSVEFGIFNIVIGVFIIYGTVNAVNLTDGIDGLCSSVTVVASIGFVAISYMLNLFGMSVLAAALGGGCAGFLIWNWHPAKVFMGDTGSMFLGGMIAALAYG